MKGLAWEIGQQLPTFTTLNKVILPYVKQEVTIKPLREDKQFMFQVEA